MANTKNHKHPSHLVDISFDCPCEWEVSKRTVGVADYCQMSLGKFQDARLVGKIDVDVWSSPTDDRNFTSLGYGIHELESMGFNTTGGTIIPLGAFKNFDSTWLHFTPVQTAEATFDCVAVLLRTKLVDVVIRLLGVSHSDSVSCWTLNKLAFDLIRDSLEYSQIGRHAT